MMGLPEEWDTCSRTILVDLKAFMTCWRDIIAVQSTSHCILLFDKTTGIQKSVFVGHTNTVESLAFSQDGTLLVSGSWDKTVKLWDIQTGGFIKTLSCTEDISSVAISPDCTTIISGGYEGTVYIWNIQTGKSNSVKIHQDKVTAIRFSPINFQQVISSSFDKTIQQWDLNKHQVEISYCEASAVWGVDYSPGGACFVSCAENIAVVRNTKSGAIVAKLDAQIDKFYSCCFSPNGGFVACGDGYIICIWDITSSEAHLVKRLVGHTGHIWSIAFSSPSSLISGSPDGSVKIWQSSSLLTGLIAVDNMPVSPDSIPISSVNVSARDGIIATSDLSGMVKLWNLKTGAYESSFSTPAQGCRDIYIAGDTLTIVWKEQRQERKYHVWDVRNNQLLQTVDSVLFCIQDLKISGDGLKIFGLDFDRELEARSIQTGEHLLYAEKRIGAVGEGGLVVHGSRVWLESSTDIGWDFGGQKVSPFLLSEKFSGKPHLCLVSQSIQGSTKLGWVQDTSTGRLVFCLPEKYTGIGSTRRLDGQYLFAVSQLGELMVVDLSSVCTE